MARPHHFISALPPRDEIRELEQMFVAVFVTFPRNVSFQNIALTWKETNAGVKLLNIVGSTWLFSPTTSLSLLNDAEINNMLKQQCWVISPQPKSTTNVVVHLWKRSIHITVLQNLVPFDCLIRISYQRIRAEVKQKHHKISDDLYWDFSVWSS